MSQIADRIPGIYANEVYQTPGITFVQRSRTKCLITRANDFLHEGEYSNYEKVALLTTTTQLQVRPGAYVICTLAQTLSPNAITQNVLLLLNQALSDSDSQTFKQFSIVDYVKRAFYYRLYACIKACGVHSYTPCS